MNYRAYQCFKVFKFASALTFILLLLVFTVSTSLLLTAPQQKPQASLSLSSSIPAARTPEEAAEWTLAHVKHAWEVNMTPDTESDLAVIFERITERGYAVSYCYGIVLTWAYVMHYNHIAHPYILIVRVNQSDEYLHAVGVAYYNNKIYTFYETGGEKDIVMMMDPFPDDPSDFPLSKILMLTKKCPPPFPVTLEEYVQLMEPKQPTWIGPSLVKASSDYVNLKYTCLRQVDPETHQFSLVLTPEGGASILKGTQNSFEVVQEFMLKLKTDVLLVRAGDWTTLILKS